jgi:hypothetical protein
MGWLIPILVFVAIVALGGAAGWVGTLLLARSRYQRIAAVARLLDAGTAKIDGSSPFRNYFLYPSVVGTFRGRPASVLLRGWLRISVSGHFVLPFQVRAKDFSKLGVIRGAVRAMAVGIYFLLLIPRPFFPTILVWKYAAAPILLGIALISVWQSYGRIGDIEFPKNAKVAVSFPGSGPLEFSTDFPPEFAAMIGRPEIQSSILQLLDVRRVDHLRAFAHFSRPGPWDSRLEANFFYRRRLLTPDSVHELLIDLSTLCERIESAGHANESPLTTAMQPA